MLELYLSRNSGHLYREPRKRHKRGRGGELSLGKEGGAPFWTWEGLGACQGHDLLDPQAQLRPMRRVADADLTLDLRVTGQT